MKEKFLKEAEKHIHHFFHVAKLHRKKWYREINSRDELIYAFFVIRRRMIQPKHYAIYESNKIVEKVIKPEVYREYELLKKLWVEKGNLKKFHTENSKILAPLDGLLEQWDINHLHLNRSRYQVFFMTEETNIYIINICKHFDRNRTNYHTSNLLEILQENWPEKYHSLKNNKFSHSKKSFYGQQKVSEFYNWLHEMADVIEKNNAEAELVFVENEFFSIQSEPTLENMTLFTV